MHRAQDQWSARYQSLHNKEKQRKILLSVWVEKYNNLEEGYSTQEIK